jgi:hypothetical protein
MAPVVLLLLLVLPVVLGLHSEPHPRYQHRKTVNFGPVHASSPAVYSLSNPSEHLAAFNSRVSGFSDDVRARSEPASVARDFVREAYSSKTFRVTDVVPSEGMQIAHVHFVEVRNGRDVIDSLVNVNVDQVSGRVLGYGSSVLEHQIEETSMHLYGGGSQTVFLSKQREEPEEEPPVDPRLPLLHLLPVVLPHDKLDLIQSLDDVFDSIIITPSFSPSSDHAFVLDNVPGAEPTHPVTTRLAYVQSPSAATGYELVWSYEFQTVNAEQWYEAHVAASKDAKIHMLVDWVRDFRDTTEQRQSTPQGPKKSPGKQKPLPKPKKPEAPVRGMPTYRVLEWGVNDPTEAKRVYASKVYDETASPYGWHDVPALAASGPSELKEGWEDEQGWLDRLERGHKASFWDTRGPNVIAQENWSGSTWFSFLL